MKLGGVRDMAEYWVNLDVEALAEALFGPCRVLDTEAFEDMSHPS